MKETLDEVSYIIEEYKSIEGLDGNTLNTMLREITSRLFYLEKHRASYKNKYERAVYNEVKNGSTVSRAVNKAEVDYPELYELRRFMEAAYRVSDAIRTNISFIKSEMNHLKTQH